MSSALPRRRLVRWLMACVVLVAVLSALVAGCGWWVLRGSLAQLDGVASMPGLQSPVLVERDAQGVPTIRATNRLDAARATGFIHAQERFFQMDLLRRLGAGEMAELLGPALLPSDRELRLHRLRSVMQEAMRRLPVAHQAVLAAYTAGVNAGLQAMRARPPEYLLLGSVPRFWALEDSLLVGGAMFFDLQDSGGADDRTGEILHQVLPAQAFAFFVPEGTDWDAPLDGSVLAGAPVPPPAVFAFGNLIAAGAKHGPPLELEEDAFVPGSNNWAVGGRRSRNGSALIANDMHLALRVPNIWYRLRLVCPTGGPGGRGLDSWSRARFGDQSSPLAQTPSFGQSVGPRIGLRPRTYNCSSSSGSRMRLPPSVLLPPSAFRCRISSWATVPGKSGGRWPATSRSGWASTGVRRCLGPMSVSFLSSRFRGLGRRPADALLARPDRLSIAPGPPLRVVSHSQRSRAGGPGGPFLVDVSLHRGPCPALNQGLR